MEFTIQCIYSRLTMWLIIRYDTIGMVNLLCCDLGVGQVGPHQIRAPLVADICAWG